MYLLFFNTLVLFKVHPNMPCQVQCPQPDNTKYYQKYLAELHYKYVGNWRSLARNVFSLWLRTNDEKWKVVALKLYQTGSEFDLKDKKCLFIKMIVPFSV